MSNGTAAFFYCLAKRAEHFEIVQSLGESAFIQAFRRFCNWRVVRVRRIYSDNVVNFASATRQLNEGIKSGRPKRFKMPRYEIKSLGTLVTHWHHSKWLCGSIFSPCA